MRKLFKFLAQRSVVVSLLLFVQLAVMLFGFYYLGSSYRIVYYVIYAAGLASILHILSKRTNPAYKMAWIIPILALPLFGSLLYLLFGGNRLSARLRRKLAVLEQNCAELPPRPEVRMALEATAPELRPISDYLAAVSFCPVCSGTRTVYYSSGEDCFADMLKELERAQKFIFLEYFIIAEGVMWDSVLEILQRKAAQGVDVRVVYDDFGSISRVPDNFTHRLRKLGIRCERFNPYIPILSSRLNNRDHRKLMIIDGRVGFTGGLNLADEYINELERFGRWKDAGLRLKGSAVSSMTAMFLGMWNNLTGSSEPLADYMPELPDTPGHGFVQPFTDNPLDDEALGQNAYLHLITHAKHTCWIMTPYLIIDDSMSEALRVAARGGVDVRIITPHIPDKKYVHTLTRAYYPGLRESGVRIYEYAPGFIHSKVFLVDGCTACVGTINMDYRSLYLHFENAVLMQDADCLDAIARDFEQTFPVCTEYTGEEKRAGLLFSLWQAILRLLAPLM